MDLVAAAAGVPAVAVSAPRLFFVPKRQVGSLRCVFTRGPTLARSAQSTVGEVVPRKLSCSWVVGDMALDTVVTFTLTPTPTSTRQSLVRSGFRPSQTQKLGGARYRWSMNSPSKSTSPASRGFAQVHHERSGRVGVTL